MPKEWSFIDMLRSEFESSRDEYLRLLGAIDATIIERRLVSQRLESLRRAIKRRGAETDFLGSEENFCADSDS